MANDIRGSIDRGHIVGDIEIDSREILIADKEKKAVKIGVYDYTLATGFVPYQSMKYSPCHRVY